MRTLIIGFVLAFLYLSPGLAQQPQPPSAQQDQTPVFRKRVNLVNVFFTVKDKHGALAPGLKQSDFQIFEDGKPQNIRYFSAESNQPLTLGILIDSSGSMQNMLPEEKIVAGDFLRQVITDKDMAFVISFDIDVDLLQDLTSDVHMLRAGLNKARINVGSGGGGFPGIGQGPIPVSNPKGTLLYDGVYLGGDEILSKQVGRKAMIILTDGVDQGSRMRLKDSIEAAQKADAICYVLLISDPRYGSDSHDMGQLAEQTGGRVITVSNPDKLSKAFSQISDELRSQYSIGYYPANEKHDGSFRKIELKTTTKEKYKIQARKGYYAPQE
ncbi:MAG TPA: VWA domain-containing protein [Candidatus Limnocylindrales bacterium]|nr:VWA domain-containing protein [Candidatus Limnocylindrales bacterium]